MHARRKPMREISSSTCPAGQPRQRFLIRHRAWIEQGVVWPPFGPYGEKIEGPGLSGRGECQVYGTPLASSKRNRGKNRFCAWELGVSGERSSCRWCIALFIEYELGKTGPGVGAQRCGNVLGGIGDASRATGEIDSSEGVAAPLCRKAMLARC